MASANNSTVRIDDPADPRIAIYRDIRERDLVRRHGHFIAEGKTVLQVLARQDRFPVHSVLVLENRLAGVASLIGALPPHVPVYSAPQPVLDAIAGFHMHRGVLAAASIPEQAADLPRPLPDAWNTLLVLSGISNHDNMGGIFRNAAAFGVDAVILDGECCDPLYRKSIRVSVGGVLKVPFFRARLLDDIVESLRGGGYSLAALSPAGTVDMTRWRPAPRQALLLGSEGHGLEPRWLENLETVSISMANGFDSLNVATAGAIALYRMQAARIEA